MARCLFKWEATVEDPTSSIHLKMSRAEVMYSRYLNQLHLCLRLISFNNESLIYSHKDAAVFEPSGSFQRLKHGPTPSKCQSMQVLIMSTFTHFTNTTSSTAELNKQSYALHYTILIYFTYILINTDRL